MSRKRPARKHAYHRFITPINARKINDKITRIIFLNHQIIERRDVCIELYNTKNKKKNILIEYKRFVEICYLLL